MSEENINENITSGAHLSYWTESAGKLPDYAPLALNISTDVVIVGGGIAGVTAAYCLTMAGKRVALLEDGFIGSGESGRTSAQVCNALDDGFAKLQKTFGDEKLKLIIESHTKAIDFIAATVKKENIDCEFAWSNAYLFLHENDTSTDLKEEKEIAEKAGIKTHLLDYVPGISDPKKACIMFENQAVFHPLKYLKGLCAAIVKNGGQIFTQTHAKDINSKGIVTDKGYSVDAQHVIVATNTPVNDKYAMHLKQVPYRTYIVGCRIPKNSVPYAIWWDSGDPEKNKENPPYHYVRVCRLDDESDLLICGGEDHHVGDPKISEADCYTPLINWVSKHFPVQDILYKWSGEVMEPADCIAYIGRNPHDDENVYICTGDSGNGLTHGTIAGMLITDLITGTENPYEKIYDPSRFKLLQAGKAVIKEMVSSAAGLFKQKSDSDLAAVKTLGTDEAVVITMDKKKYGIYKDTKNVMHMVSAECTHLGCVVKWNNDEKSWDCPCHGSRFSCTGKNLEGPANTPLEYKIIDVQQLSDNKDEAAE